MPINMGNFNSATSLLNYTPGINGGSAFGGDSSYGNALLIDGVDTRDPEAGSAWVFFNYNIIEEVQVARPRRARRVRRVLRRRGQHDHQVGRQPYSGLFEARFTNDGLAGQQHHRRTAEAEPGARQRRTC